MEYLVCMGIELVGIGVFALFMGEIQRVMLSEEAFKDKVKDRIEELDWWLYLIDKSRPEEELPDPLYESIKSFVKASFVGDFNMILEDFDFYFKLKP